MPYLTPDRIRNEFGLTIHEKIIPWGARWPRTVYRPDGSIRFAKGSRYKADRKLSKGSGRAEYITIHNTGRIKVSSRTTPAEQYSRATWPGANMNDARVHYYIDDTDCWQLLREDEVGWHAGDGRGPGNESSIAIEIIMNGSGDERDVLARERGALLAAILLHRHGLAIDRLVTHHHWYPKKKCPAYLLPCWEEFRKLVVHHLSTLSTEQVFSYKKGDLVSLHPDAVYYTGKKIPSWVLQQNWYLREDPRGDRAVIDRNESGTSAIRSPVSTQYLSLVKTNHQK